MHSHRIHTLLATGTFLTFGFASAVAVGAIPHHQQVSSSAAVVAPSHQLITAGGTTRRAPAVPARHQATTNTPATTTTRPVVAATKHHTTIPAVAHSSAATTPRPRTSHTPVVAAPAHHHHTVVPTTPTKSAQPAPTKAKLAPRTTPSASAVQAALQGLKHYVHSILTPTAGEVAQFGNMVCTAYDHGNTTKQIEATILSKVSSLPLTTIAPGAADYVVRTAVKLYCPGYQSRLGSAAA